MSAANSQPASPEKDIIFAVRGSAGMFLYKGLKSPQPIVSKERDHKDESYCRVFAFSPDGSLFAYCDVTETVILDTRSGAVRHTFPMSRTTHMAFSPKGLHFCTWQPYVVYGQNPDNKMPDPNLRVYCLKTGELVAEYVHKKQQDWKPQWSDDERLCVRLQGSELMYHRNGLKEKYTEKCVVKNLSNWLLSKGPPQNHVAVYIPGVKGQPSSVRLIKADGSTDAICNKTFFQSDTVSFTWNSKGSACTVIASTDVDQSGKSYYGEQRMYLLMARTAESHQVELAKTGPVYSIEWSPNGDQFAVVYGFMPARATLYDLRAQVLCDFDCGPRNEVRFNQLGNIMLLTGFGNLSGNMEFYAQNEKKLVTKCTIPDTTQFDWAPDGQHFITATTTPRLRCDNNYRIWHYTNRLLFEKLLPAGEELWEVAFAPLAAFAVDFQVQFASKQGAAAGLARSANAHDSIQATGIVTAKGSYVPPHMRKGNTLGAQKPQQNAAPVKSTLTEHEKKVRAVQNKLKQIKQLKDKQEKGQKLEDNQIEKIKTENALMEELEKLQLDA